MATARTKLPPSPTRFDPEAESDPLILRLFDATFRFLASLKLAIILLMTLAGVLAFGTFYERNHGIQAVQLDIYQSKWFALLLALLGVNILCAALIRFPWKKRQTGFVITHAGLITLLIGSFLSLKMADEGRVGLPEGESTAEYVRTEFPVLRLQKLDPETGAPTRRFVVPFAPGASAWETERLARESLLPGSQTRRELQRAGLYVLGFGLIIGGIAVTRLLRDFPRFVEAMVQGAMIVGGLSVLWSGWSLNLVPRREVLSHPTDPFRLAVTDFLPSATEPQPRHEPSEDGIPMLRTALMIKPPGAPEFSDGLDGRGWIVSNKRLGRGTLDVGPAAIQFHDLRGERGRQALADFLEPPADPSIPTARFHYRDLKGQDRAFNWVIREEDATRLEGGNVLKAGKSQLLPDSDLTATLVGVIPLPTRDRTLLRGLEPAMLNLLSEMGEAADEPAIRAAVFKVRQGQGPEVSHFGWAGLPLAPSVVPLSQAEASDKALLSINFFDPPKFEPGETPMSTRLSVIDIALAEGGFLYYRVFGRNGLRSPERLKIAETVPLFGGDQMPMQLALRVDEFLPSGRTRMVCEPLPLPPNRMAEEAVPAAQIELSVNGETRSLWLPRAMGFDPEYQLVEFADGPWQISYDFDRRPLDCQITLHDFDPSNDPGTTARMAFRSDVTVSEPNARPEPPTAFARLEVGDNFYFLNRPRESFLKTANDRFEPFDGGPAETAADLQAEVRRTPPPIKITMNNPLARNNWKFFQASYQPMLDRNRQPTGSYISYLSVRYDPAWPVVYGGCAVIVLGIFVQFYMRAGVFTEQGKRGREKQAEGEPGVESATKSTASSAPRDDL